MSLIDHNILIFIPLIGVIAGFGLGFLTLSISIFLEHYKDKSWVKRYKIDSTELLVDKFELMGLLTLIVSQIGIIIAIFSGINSVGNFEDAINNDLLEIKIRLSIFIFFLLWTPIILKLYINQKFGKDIFQDSPKVVPILYLLPQLISIIFIVIIVQKGIDYSTI